MWTRDFLFFPALLFAATFASPQAAYTPESGSTERQAILGAARSKVASDLAYEGKILFRVDSLKVSEGWALLHGQPLSPAGEPVRKVCVEADEVTMVLLRLYEGRWRVERGGTVCANDVFWLGWQEELDVPPQIFDLQQDP